MTAVTRFRKLISGPLIAPLAMSLAILVLAVSELGLNRLKTVSEERSASVQTQITVGRLRRALLFMESSKRGYMLTDRSDYLQPYVEQEKVFTRTLGEVAKLAQVDERQGARLRELLSVSTRKHAEMTEAMRLQAAGQDEAALAVMLTDVGQQLMFSISEIVDEVLREESLYQDHSTDLRDAVVRQSRLAIWLLVGLCVVGAYMLMRLTREKEHQRQVNLLQVLAQRDRLDEEVTRRTDEVISLAQHMERVREDERARLARELHDELGGLLTSAKLDVARMRKRIVDDTGMLQGLLAHLAQALDSGISLKRRVIEDLRPSSLSNLGLQRTLEIQCTEFAQRAELKVVSDIDDVKLSPERSLAAYRLLQEALTNVAKYAKAQHLHVSLKHKGDQAELVVKDDGVGFELQHLAAGGGHGLQGMRFRIHACGGDVRIDSTPGQGTVITALLPL